MFFRAIAPRFEAASIRRERERVGTKERPVTEPAVARCVFDGRWFTRHPLKQGEKCMISRLETTKHPSA
jgi:hypothetical protein